LSAGPAVPGPGRGRVRASITPDGRDHRRVWLDQKVLQIGGNGWLGHAPAYTRSARDAHEQRRDADEASARRADDQRLLELAPVLLADVALSTGQHHDALL